MKSLPAPLWLQLPLSSTKLSKPFQKTATVKGYATLGQLLSVKLIPLLKMEWFTLPMIEEITAIVKAFKKKDADSEA